MAKLLRDQGSWLRPNLIYNIIMRLLIICIIITTSSISISIAIISMIILLLLLLLSLLSCVYIYIYISTLPCATSLYPKVVSIQHAKPKVIIQDADGVNNL